MPDFANLRTALLCQGEPQRVPAIEFAVDPTIIARFLGRKPETLDDQAEFYVEAGYDFVPIVLGIKHTLLEAGPAFTTSKTAHYGAESDQTSTRHWVEEGIGQISDKASLDNFAWPDADDYPYENVARLGQVLPPEAKVVPTLGYIFAGPWMLMGFERFCYDLAEDGELVGRVVERVGRLQMQVAENLLQFDCVGAVSMPDDMAYTTSLMVKPEFLRKHVLPWHKKIGQRVRFKDLPYLFHSDGRYLPVLDDLVECGYNAIHPCEPASMDIAELKGQYGGRLCLCGNIDLDSTLTRGTPADVEEEVKLRLRTIAPGGGYCCGSSNSVPEYVPYENYLAMIETVRRYGKYPIGGF